MKIVGYMLAFLVIVNLLERWVRAYETKVLAAIKVEKQAMDNMTILRTEMMEFPEDGVG